MPDFRQGNHLTKAPQTYVTVTLRCVECHRYLARGLIAK